MATLDAVLSNHYSITPQEMKDRKQNGIKKFDELISLSLTDKSILLNQNNWDALIDSIYQNSVSDDKIKLLNQLKTIATKSMNKDDKFRTISLKHKATQKILESNKGCMEYLKGVGFHRDFVSNGLKMKTPNKLIITTAITATQHKIELINLYTQLNNIWQKCMSLMKENVIYQKQSDVLNKLISMNFVNNYDDYYLILNELGAVSQMNFKSKDMMIVEIINAFGYDVPDNIDKNNSNTAIFDCIANIFIEFRNIENHKNKNSEEPVEESKQEYIRSKLVEKRGKMKFDKYLQRKLKLRNTGVLEYWMVQWNAESVLKGTIDLIKDDLNEVKPNNYKGQKLKFGWQLQTDARTYYFTSQTDIERQDWIKQIQDTYQMCKNQKTGNPSESKQNTTKKSWGSALRKFKDTAKSGGVGNAMKALKTDAKDIKKQKFRQKKESRKVVATLDTSSIFGFYNAKDDGIEEKKKKQESEDEKKEEISVPNQHKLLPVELDELLDTNVHSFSSKLGVKASRFNGKTSFNDDLIASNEFCQLAIGKGLINDNKTDKKHKKRGVLNLKINKRPKDDLSDDEDDGKYNSYNLPMPTLRHNGKLREKIDFHPGTKDFTICCEIFCENVAAGNIIVSNRNGNKGFEFIAPRAGSRRMAIWMQGNESNIDVVLPALNVGNTELFQQVWYHVAVVCKRAKLQELLGTLNKKSTKGNFVINNLRMSGKEMMGKTSDSIFASKSKITAKATRQNNMEATDFAVYLNGVTDGKLSLDGAPSLDTTTCCIGSAIDMSMTSCFAGEIKNIQIFDQALSDDEIYSIAHKKGNYSLQKTVLLSYIPSSLKVEIPICNVKYNGPIHRELPTYLQWQPSKQSFTISAWIMCVRSVSKMGSVIVSNLTVNNKGNNIGFELICPTTGNGVIGMQCTGLKENGVLSLGTTSIEKNRFYHIAIIIERVITYGAKPDATSIVVFINGKQDGSFNINNVFDYSGRAWSIGYNNKYKKESRFEGSISNLRIFKRALVEAEIACIYATDTRERKFDKNEEILYYIENQFNNNNSNNLQWVKGIYLSSNISDGEITIYDSGKNKKTITMNEIIKLENKISKFIPATDSEMITNLGGMIHGKDFDGNKWRIYSSETKFLRHITSPSCFTLLSQLKPFPKHTFELMINNKSINNKYILNRLLYSSHELLKNINNKQLNLWPYFNEYILSWNIWEKQENFKLLQDVARRLQYKYKKQQFDLFDKLKIGKWNVFNIPNNNHKTIANRQDSSFEGACTIEFNTNDVSKHLAQEYDQKVVSMILWGRCTLLNDSFQQFICKMFQVDKNKFKYKIAPQKTYERMIEKTIEYQSENAKFPAAYRICDVLRCSITCQNLNDMFDAYNLLKNNITIIRTKNRLLPEFDAKQTDGYRDMLINVLFTEKKTNLSAICEVQFQLQAYLDIKKKQHKYYKIVRAMDYKSLLRNYEARKFDSNKNK